MVPKKKKKISQKIRRREEIESNYKKVKDRIRRIAEKAKEMENTLKLKFKTLIEIHNQTLL
tara:strand:+ start:543 stop:725 length:183 start_codon:yes stop_codon:yes gene_type:complete